jgi:disulfide bond formation protein DsbB
MNSVSSEETPASVSLDSGFRRNDSNAPRALLLAKALALAVPAALLAGAFAFEYVGGLYPCEMCWWQRYPHAAAILLAAFAFTAPTGSSRARTLTLLAALAIAISGAIGFYHAGVELGIFTGFTTCTTTAKAASTDELLKQLMKVPLVRCDQVQWSFLGISLAGWNAILSLSGAAAILWLTLGGRRAR